MKMSGSRNKHGVSEMLSARTKFDATLQLLVDKRDEGHLSSEGEGGISQADILSDSSPISSPTKRSLLNKGSRKRKRRDDQDSGQSGMYHHTYVMKLFDRSVDLAQFDQDTALYPIARAWLKNQPHKRDLGPRERTPTPEPDPAVSASEDEETENIPNIYKLPSPIKPDPDGYQDLRIPPLIPQQDEHLDINYDPDQAPPPEQLLLNHMDRWKQIRNSWKDSSRIAEMRCADSMNLLRDVFENQLKEG
ncbi:hypothetical protein KUTeg_020561 [Tegillarca granosa]|uniref:Uncharacterized protein n=1 Tax=Tegillarca granosa TaxID=220873 RepID=A0ABQ9EAS9_TEGGR|nr:hypothetical protein KUTeg_020561 [Tegillarca granosa]